MFTWKITRLDSRTSDNFVLAADWQLTKTEGDTATTIYGNASFGGEIVKPFEQLEEQDVLSWLWQQVSKEETEAQMKTVFVNKKTIFGLPWENKG